MAGKYDDQIIICFNQGKGSRLIAREIGISNGHVGKRMKALGLHSGRPNQYRPNNNTQSIIFSNHIERLPAAAEQFFKYICDLAGFDYAEPASPKAYDLLVDFGNGWQKVQVKSSVNTQFKIDRRRSVVENGLVKHKRIPYEDNDIDYIFFYRSDRRCWLVPFSEITTRRSTSPHTMFPNFEINMSDL